MQSELDEWMRQAHFAGKDVDRARCILERRIPFVVSEIARDTGLDETTINKVLEAAQTMHTNWPDDRETVPLTFDTFAGDCPGTWVSWHE